MGAAAGQTPAAARPSPFSLQFNLDYTTAYFYRGIIQEDTGLILQPAAKLTANLHTSDEWKLDAYFGNWNSFHGQKTGARTDNDVLQYWYESDVLGGLSLSCGNLNCSAQYIFLTSPSNAYDTVQEFDLTVGFNDTEFLHALAMHPYALMAIETGSNASDGSNSDTGTYLELGVGPGFSADVVGMTASISFPICVGLSLHDYYQNAQGEDDTFGFVQIGAKASIPLPFSTPSAAWSCNIGVSGLFLGDHTAGYNGGDHEQFIATAGIQLNF